MRIVTKAEFLQYYEAGWLSQIMVFSDHVIARVLTNNEAIKVTYP